MRQEGKVDIRIDSGIFNSTAQNGFGKPNSQAVYASVACEFMINALKKTLAIVLNRDALSSYLLRFNMCHHLYMYQHDT